MKRWGLLGLLALVACAREDEPGASTQNQACPGVIAGAIPGTESIQGLSPVEPRAASQGRQRYLVRYKPHTRLDTSRVSSAGGQVRRVYRHVPALSAWLSDEERSELAEDPMVEAIEPDSRLYALGLPAVPAQALLKAAVPAGSTGEYTPGLALVQAPQVWDQNMDGVLDVGAPTGQGIRVCVIDSGIDPAHPELMVAYAGGKDFVDGDDEPWDQIGERWGGSHGTHVAGTIAAQLSSGGDNVGSDMDRDGVVGVAPGAQLLIARVLDTDGVAWMSEVLAALEWCEAEQAHIATLSLGGGLPSDTQQEAFERAGEKMLVIAAAGNTGKSVEYPAAYPSVLAVGAVDSEMNRASFSSHGVNLALMAPGVDVLSTVIQGQGTTSQVEVGNVRHASRSLFLAPVGEHSGRLVDCRNGGTMGSCPQATCDGFVAYVEHSREVPLHLQLTHVMKQGARAVILGDEPRQGGWMEVSIGRRGRWVPSALVSHASGEAMRQLAGHTAHVWLQPSDYAHFSGTSMAAPHVTGVAALLWSRRPELTPEQVRHLLVSTAKDLGDAGWDMEHGYGLVQAWSALQALEALP